MEKMLVNRLAAHFRASVVSLVFAIGVTPAFANIPLSVASPPNPGRFECVKNICIKPLQACYNSVTTKIDIANCLSQFQTCVQTNCTLSY